MKRGVKFVNLDHMQFCTSLLVAASPKRLHTGTKTLYLRRSLQSIQGLRQRQQGVRPVQTSHISSGTFDVPLGQPQLPHVSW